MKPTKRFKGYYRALNNPKSPNHAWAVRLSKKNPIAFLFEWLYTDHIATLVYKDNPWISLIKKTKPSSYLPVPLKLPKKTP